MMNPPQGSRQAPECPSCGAPVESGAGYCSGCGQALSPADLFAPVEAAREQLTRDRAGGRISEEDYRERSSELTVLDDRGSWRLMAGTGPWMWHDGASWIARDPRAGAETVPARSTSAAPPAVSPPKRRPWLTCLLVTAVVALLGCACGSWALWQGHLSGSDALARIKGSDPLATASQAIELDDLSGDQQAIVEEFGWPHSFTIADVTDADGVSIRHETWQYLDAGVAYTFSGGQFLSWDPLEAEQGKLTAAPYHPTQFDLGQTSEEVRGAIMPGSWERLEGLGALLGGVEMYAARQLLLTFRDDRLILVDAVAVAGGS